MKEHKKLIELRLQRAYVLIGALADEKVCIVNLYQREKVIERTQETHKTPTTESNVRIGALADEKVYIAYIESR